jgi:ATP-dependent RNA helicase SUPV3L1/SUV3
MADLKKPVDVAVIDEYQLISDFQRGWAWTRALLGLQAKEIHLTGDLSRVRNAVMRHVPNFFRLIW